MGWWNRIASNIMDNGTTTRHPNHRDVPRSDSRTITDTAEDGITMGEPLFDVTRFDIEQEIMEIGNFVTILKNYADMVYDGRWTSSNADDIHTTLHGFAHLLDAHADKMMQSHCKHYRLNEWSDNNEES